jgi:hypothetical protein
VAKKTKQDIKQHAVSSEDQRKGSLELRPWTINVCRIRHPS